MEKHGKRVNIMYTLVRRQSISQQFVMLNNFKGALRKNNTNLEELEKHIPFVLSSVQILSMFIKGHENIETYT